MLVTPKVSVFLDKYQVAPILKKIEGQSISAGGNF